MFAAAPALKQLLGGLAIHPYGPVSGSRSRLPNMVEQQKYAMSLGMEYPYVYITEYGVEFEPGNEKKEAKQSKETKEVYEQLKTYSWVKGIWYFNFVDEPRTEPKKAKEGETIKEERERKAQEAAAETGLWGWYGREPLGYGSVNFSSPRPVKATVESFA